MIVVHPHPPSHIISNVNEWQNEGMLTYCIVSLRSIDAWRKPGMRHIHQVQVRILHTKIEELLKQIQT